MGGEEEGVTGGGEEEVTGGGEEGVTGGGDERVTGGRKEGRGDCVPEQIESLFLNHSRSGSGGHSDGNGGLSV